MRLFELWLLALSCKGCEACVNPSIPHDDNGDSRSGDSSAETGDSTQPIDTQPETECVFPEIEPNDWTPAGGGDPPTVIEMEEWACGDISAVGDNDHLQVTADGAIDWIRFDVVAAAEGSSLDPNLLVPDDDYGAAVEDSDVNSVFTEDSNDPVLCFPLLSTPHTFDLVLADSDWLSGKENYHWKLRARAVKPPVSWTMTEVEPNDPGLGGTPQHLAENDRVFGYLTSAIDVDAYTFDVPLVDDKHAVRVTIDVDAYRFGSPALTEITLIDPTGSVVTDGYRRDEFDRKADPYYEVKDPVPGTYRVSINLHEGTGSDAFWYVLGDDVEVVDSSP
jgi:hypothetical protein